MSLIPVAKTNPATSKKPIPRNRATYPKAKQYHAPHPKPIQSLKMSHASCASYTSCWPKAKREAPNPPPINSNADRQSTLMLTLP